ncbi:DUF2510 domain-containing protein [Williamsia sp. SKLECPSW1]
MQTWLIVVIVVIVVLVIVGAVSPAIRAARATPPPTPAGWYPDLHDPSIERYHDGDGWTQQTRPNPEES